MGVDLRGLHPLEVRVLRHVDEGIPFTTETLVSGLELNIGQSNQALSWLAAKELIAEKHREERTFFELTELGAVFADIGTPVERIYKLISEEKALTLPEIAERLELENRDVGSAFGSLAKSGYLAMDGNKQVSKARDETPPQITAVRALLVRGLSGPIEESSLSEEDRGYLAQISKKRGAGNAAFRVVDRETIYYLLTDSGVPAKSDLIESGVTGDEIGILTSEMLASGEWRNREFRSYNIGAPPKRVLPGRTNPYSEYLRDVKDKLVSLGFEEFDGPLVETEFWNGDALFMPQFHSARDIHDVYYLKDPSHAKAIEQPWLDQVAKTHEDGWNTKSQGWGYPFDKDFTRRLVLRSQGTVLSAKQLPKAKVPGRYFGVVRCFRYDQIDATHGADFYQTEGIVLSKDVNFKTLLGLLKMFALEVAGAQEFRYVPAYFPFTEPSIEIHIKHPVLGWFELGGSGIFRPEVTKPLGVDVPVLAWGLGIDRMALMQLGLDDLRELFTYDIEQARLRRRD